MKLYEPSIFLSDFMSLTLSGVSSPGLAFDNDKQTLINTSQSNPNLTLDAGSGEMRTANAVWLRSRGYTAVSVEYGDPWVEAGQLDDSLRRLSICWNSRRRRVGIGG